VSLLLSGTHVIPSKALYEMFQVMVKSASSLLTSQPSYLPLLYSIFVQLVVMYEL